MRYITTVNGFTSIALRSQRTRKSSWRDLTARSSILSSAAAALIGRGGEKLSIPLRCMRPQGRVERAADPLHSSRALSPGQHNYGVAHSRQMSLNGSGDIAEVETEVTLGVSSVLFHGWFAAMMLRSRQRVRQRTGRKALCGLVSERANGGLRQIQRSDASEGSHRAKKDRRQR
jgi:hypothetical protein